MLGNFFKITVTCFLCSFLALPSLAAEIGAFTVESFIKNITQNSDPAGDTQVLAYAGDELRNLLIITNNTDKPQTYSLSVQLPEKISLVTGTTEQLSSDWLKIDDLTSLTKIELPANKETFIRYTTHVADKLNKQGNFILSTAIQVKSIATGETHIAMSDAYFTDLPAGTDLSQKYGTFTDFSEKIRLEQKVIEEKKIIEKDFAEAQNNTMTGSDLVQKAQNYWYLLLPLSALLIFLPATIIYIFYRKRHEHSKKHNLPL